MSEQRAYQNTDRELWREREGDYYADSVHVTQGGGLGIKCGGTVYVKSLRQWHALAEAEPPASRATPNDDGLAETQRLHSLDVRRQKQRRR